MILNRNKLKIYSNVVKGYGFTQQHIKIRAKYLGIFDTFGNNQHNSTIRFIGRFDICKYFPGYLRTKEIWNKLRGYNLNSSQFDNVVTGKNDVVKGLDYYFNEKSISNTEKNIDKDVNQDQTDKEKEVNIKIDNEDHTININIMTKQETIEDAWS